MWRFLGCMAAMVVLALATLGIVWMHDVLCGGGC